MSGSPSTAVLASSPSDVAKPKPVPGWKQLSRLLPYITRFKGQVAFGMVGLGLMGIVGTLQPLAFGVIMDCLSGNAQPLGQLGQTSPWLLHTLVHGYAPSSERTLAIYCLVAIAIVALKGVFLLLVALGSDRHFARHRIRLAQRSAGPAAGDGAGILRAQPHRRTDVARHQRSEPGAHGARAGHHVQRHHARDHGAGGRPDVAAFADAEPLGADPRADCGRSRCATLGK